MNILNEFFKKFCLSIVLYACMCYKTEIQYYITFFWDVPVKVVECKNPIIVTVCYVVKRRAAIVRPKTDVRIIKKLVVYFEYETLPLFCICKEFGKKYICV